MISKTGGRAGQPKEKRKQMELRANRGAGGPRKKEKRNG